ncbi:hypothetical protein NQ317_010875 [Molorchus minor]|uniref:Uncharacterized protein n=1 Tax=Molorchus minor TaxID=1323400 RepID=A0ABQ9JCP4_9CUCU|nr:hypothetical protein NQ317_010875 [Molorchus minor]
MQLVRLLTQWAVLFGSMICFASYNKYSNSILYDTIAIWLITGITSLLVGIFAFATIGNLAFEQGIAVEDVIDDGPGLIFVVYPQTMAIMAASQVWSVFFFFMLLCLGLNTQFAIVEVVVTSVQDEFPIWMKKKILSHEILVSHHLYYIFFFAEYLLEKKDDYGKEEK